MVTFKSRNGLGFILFIVVLGAGLVTVQWLYLRKHAPLAAAGLAEAQRVGDTRLEQIGLPPGAQLMEPIEKRTITGGRGKWQGTPMEATWVALYDTPGTHADTQGWYRDHLPTQGWKPVEWNPPTELVKRYYQDKWLLFVENDAFFTGRNPHARFRLRLSWDYRHPTER